VSAAQKQAADDILRAVGQTVWLDDEAQIDAVTAVSAAARPMCSTSSKRCSRRRRKWAQCRTGQAAGHGHLYGRGATGAAIDEPVTLLRERVTSKAAPPMPR
jgi:pyrroline-5-carboxylate reductase